MRKKCKKLYQKLLSKLRKTKLGKTKENALKKNISRTDKTRKKCRDA